MADKELNELAREVMNLRQSVSLDHEVEEYVNHLHDTVQEDLDMFRERGAYRRFLLSYIDEAYRNFRDPDSGRERPLCNCPSPSCDLKDGKIPSKMELSDTLRGGFVEFRQEHRGQPIILDEARGAWREKKKNVKSTLRTMIAIMRRNSLPEHVDVEELDAQRGGA
jgi:hypothetical protein